MLIALGKISLDQNKEVTDLSTISSTITVATKVTATSLPAYGSISSSKSSCQWV